ncbi:hypothetical protein C1H76_0965 [Elsinoe australis]|uniref:Regulator of volume decrease after cellular swelling-domain-containing protein n=1 Tax=Elsinoe australis TaxID=40998 RepID=A0A4U7BAP6_9PEZI|nr:hypothetical protein C1H76_0965 [Elsinoe australis]
MALEVFSSSPSLDQFQPLEEYQSSTPATFFSGKPVLHYHNPSCTIRISASDLASNPTFSSLQPAPASTASRPNGDTNGATLTNDDTTIEIQAWITSSHFTIFSSSSNKGLHIPYPSISLHAQQGNGLYMQLILSDMRHTSDDELETLEMTVTPGAQSAAPPSMEIAAAADVSKTEIEKLYQAVSDCADLHPDPDPEEENQEGMAGLMASLQGGGNMDLNSGGWITAENMHEHLDAEGNVVFPGQGEAVDGEGLGPGAGTRRGADEDGVDGDGNEDGEETKWRRTG